MPRLRPPATNREATREARRKRGERRIHLQQRKGRRVYGNLQRGAEKEIRRIISAALTDRLRKERSQRVGRPDWRWERGWIRRGGRAGAAVPCDSGCPLPCLCVSVFIGGRTREQSSGGRLIGAGPVARGTPADPVRSGAVAVAMAPTRRRRPAKGKVGRRRSCVDFVAACLVSAL